jgi:PAS domain S-box-containing protein
MASPGDALTHAILETAFDGIFITDHTSAITDFNPAAERMFGLPRAAVIGRPIDQLLLPPTSLEVSGASPSGAAALAATLLAGHPVEMTARHADGTHFQVELAVSRVSTQGTAQFAGVFRDVRERKSYEAAAVERQRLSAFAWDVGAALTESETLESMLERCARSMVEHLGVALARVWTRDPEQDGLELRASAGPLSMGTDGIDRVPHCRIDDIARDREGIVTNAVISDPRIDQAWAAEHRIASVAAYPLIVDERVVGVIVMYGHAAISDATAHAVSSIAHVVGSAIERKRIEVSQARLAAIVEATTDLVSITALDSGTLAYMNQAGRRMLGIGAQESVSDLSQFRTAEFLAHWENVILPTALREGLWSGETTYSSRDGRAIPVLQVVIVHPTADGKIQLSTIARDITERKRIEEELRTTDERTRFAHAAAGIGIWEMQLSTGRITWSDALPAIHGVPAAAFDGTAEAFSKLVHPEDRDAVRLALESAISTCTDFSLEYRILWPDGTLHWLDTRNHVHCAKNGRAESVVGVAIDITERKLLEARLRQAQKMEAIGQLAGGVAHDFNNLLTVILGYAEFMGADPSCSDQHRRDVQEIIKAAERASGLTRQLLAFSRNQVLQAKLVDVNGLVGGMSELLGRLIGEHIELVTVLAPHLGTVLADYGQLEQVLMNLAVNARDAMPSGGRLVVETGEVALDHFDGLTHQQAVVPGRYVMIAVTDSGTGIDAGTKRRLFEPFFSTKERGKGTGLGLAMVYGIVKQSGGYIWVFSEPGHGATFKVYLPRSDDGAPAGAAVRSDEPAPRGAETVLLVEDETGVRRLAQRILENAGYRVIEASSPAEARKLFAEHRATIDLVLTDVVMPESSGPELFQSLAAQQPALKVLYMSGYTEDAIVRQAGLDRGLPFVQKPFTAAVLARTVRDALRRAASQA